MSDGSTDGSVRGDPMDRSSVDAFLREVGTGVLSLADGGEAYAVPVSFGYDGEQLVFDLIRFGDDSKKIDLASTTDVASFTAYRFDDEHTWRSVVVQGPIERVPDDEREAAKGVLLDNGRFASMYPPGEPMTEHALHRLRVETVSGQQGQGYGYDPER